MPILSVPYFIQPDGSSCQSTVLKMMASYIDKKRGQPTQGRVISQIKTAVNGDPRRPDKAALNAWKNFHWWLQNEFGDMTFQMDTTPHVVNAVTVVRRSIDKGWPVLVSTNRNMNNSGHIILVVGVMRLENGVLVEPLPGPVNQPFVFVCHDPYGRFGRQFFSSDTRWGAGRYDMPGGYSSSDGQIGPGMYVGYTLDGIGRSEGTFLLIRAE